MVGSNANPWTPPGGGNGRRRHGWGASLMADKGTLLLMLYDKAIRSMEEAVDLIEAGDMVGKGERLIRAQDIVLLLADALDKDSEDPNAASIARNLERTYLYVYQRLIRGNNYLDRGAIREARRLMGRLQEAWTQVVADAATAAAVMPAPALRPVLAAV